MKKALVFGGGLTGLVAARTLARHGFEVRIVDSSGLAGGKSGADAHDGRMWEYSYHIFPAWYRNLRAILEELEIKLIDLDRWHYVEKPGASWRWITSRVPDSLVSLYRSLRDGLLLILDAIIYWYFVLDMLAQPLSRKHILYQVSWLGMMRGRWYMTPHIPEMEKENVLKASAIPVYELSAMRAKKISAYWVTAPLPFLSILPRDLQTAFIDKIVGWTQDAGAELLLGEHVARVEAGGARIKRVRTENVDTGAQTEHEADLFLFTTPLEVTRRLLRWELQKVEPALGEIEHLEAAPMAALTLMLNQRRTDLPKEHVFFRQGRYGLSFIDVAPHWPNQTTSALTFISSNVIPLRHLTEAEHYDALMGEIHEYLAISKTDVTDKKLNANTDVPLFINTIGAWAPRPRIKAHTIKNLYFAGEWVRNPIDLACMRPRQHGGCGLRGGQRREGDGRAGGNERNPCARNTADTPALAPAVAEVGAHAGDGSRPRVVSPRSAVKQVKTLGQRGHQRSRVGRAEQPRVAPDPQIV